MCALKEKIYLNYPPFRVIDGNGSKGGFFMDKDQKREIVRLRLCGQGYRRIAKEVGLTRDIVRNFCKSRGLDGYGWNGVEIIEEKIAADKGLCLECRFKTHHPKSAVLKTLIFFIYCVRYVI